MTDVAYHDRSPRTPRTPIDVDADFDMDTRDIRTATDNNTCRLHSPVDTYIPASARALFDRTDIVDVDVDVTMDDTFNEPYTNHDRKPYHASPEPGLDRPVTPPLRYSPPRGPANAPSHPRLAHLGAHGRSNSMDNIDSFRPPTRPRLSGHGTGTDNMGRPRAYSERRDPRPYDRDGGRGAYGSPRSSAGAPTRPPPKVGANQVVGVFGLSIRTTERDLEDEFGRYGEVDKVVITDRSRGFGFITMRSIEAAARVVDKMNGSVLHGRTLRVDFSATQKAHAPTPGEYKGQPRPVDDRADPRGGGRGYSGYRDNDRDGRYDSRDSRDRDYRRDRDRDDRYSSRDDRDRRGHSDRYDRYDDRDYRRRDRDGDPYGGRSRRDRSPSPRRRYSRSPERKRDYSPRRDRDREAPYASAPAPPPQAYDANAAPPAAAAGAAPTSAPLSAALGSAPAGQAPSVPAPAPY